MSSSLPPPSQPQTVRSPAPRPVSQMIIGCLVIPLITLLISLGGFFYLRSGASSQLTLPDNAVALVRAAPEPEAALLARFGEGATLEITGRTADWQWLEVALWDGGRGWMQRPLDILVWQIEAADVVRAAWVPTEKVGKAGASATSPAAVPAPVTPIPEAMVALPATTFMMGSPQGLGDEDEWPAHPVTLSAYEIDRTEVTLGQYWRCVEAGACAPPAQTGLAYLNDPAFDNHPIVNIPWLEASHYCNWRGKRLPTEAEWEGAAAWDATRRAKLQWPWGNAEPAGEVNLDRGTEGQTGEVGSFTGDSSPAGVLDMGGNASEWVSDWYKVDYYSLAESVDPGGPAQRRGEGSGRVVRGGSFADGLNEARAANRRHLAEKSGYPTVGFRCARDNAGGG